MSNSNVNEIKKWPILNVLDPELIKHIRMALVFGELGDKAIIVTDDDKVYAFGNNKTGCLGIGITMSTFAPIELQVLSGRDIIKFARSGWSESNSTNILALTKTGEVYSWGQTTDTPNKITNYLYGKKVMDVVCGQHYSLALTDQGQVYIWGEIQDEAGKLTRIEPTNLSSLFEDENIVSITSELNSILALTKTGWVYQWNPNTNILKHMPKRVEDLVDIAKLVSGYDHTLALSKEGFLYIWGSNGYGQFGNGNVVGSMKPYKVNSQLVGHIVDIVAGQCISVAVNKRGQVHMWGQCCTQTISIPISVPLSNIHDAVLYFSLSRVMRESRKFENNETSLLESIQQNFDNFVTSDLEIKIQDKTIHVHKAILELRSGYFKRIFKTKNKMKIEFDGCFSIIVHKEYSYEVYKAFLQYLYTGNVDASPEQVLELKKIADQYFDTELEAVCNQIALNNQKQKSTSNTYELKKWPIFNLLDFELIAKVRMAIVFGRYGNEAIIITDDDKVYGLGTNGNGCLGIGIKTTSLHATEVEILSGKGVIKLTVGGIDKYHVLALTRTGKVYSWGHNEFGQLGIGSLGDQWTPIQIKHQLSNKEVIDIACGNLRSLALTNEGKVYQWGYDAGCTSTTQIPIENLNKLLNHANIKSIACMLHLKIAVTESDEIYCWGKNYKPNTFDIASERFKTPEKIQDLGESKIVKIAAGMDHILILNEEGALRIWGRNMHGELGCGNTSDSWMSYKMPMWMMGPIADVAAGTHISAAVNKNGDVFMWGRCLGHVISIPTRTGFSKISDVILNFCTPRGTHQVLQLFKREETSVLESIAQGFNDMTTSDLIIKVQHKPIYVHKIILRLRSSYCERMFKEDWAGKNPIIIEDKYSYEVYTSFFKYLYTESVDVTPENLNGLMDLASQFLDSRLMNLCTQRIEKIQRYKFRNFVAYNHLIYNN